MTKDIHQITVKEYIEAIRKNGLPQAHRTLVICFEGKYVEACAVGQAGINIADNPYFFADYQVGNDIIWHTIELNDRDHLSLEEIADVLTKQYSDKLDDILVPPYSYRVSFSASKSYN